MWVYESTTVEQCEIDSSEREQTIDRRKQHILVIIINFSDSNVFQFNRQEKNLRNFRRNIFKSSYCFLIE